MTNVPAQYIHKNVLLGRLNTARPAVSLTRLHASPPTSWIFVRFLCLKVGGNEVSIQADVNK